MDHRHLVLVSDAQRDSARLTQRLLTAEGFAADVVSDPTLTTERAWTINPDVVLLDVTRDRAAGLAVMTEIQAVHAVPVVLSASTARVRDVCVGLDAGASDFVVRPFDGRELAARMRSLIRRRRHLLQGRRRLGGTLIDLDRNELVVHGRRVEMRREAWQILAELLAHEGTALWHDDLLETVFGPGYVGDRAFLRAWIARLRWSLGVAAWQQGPIRTVDGVGYAIDPTGRIPLGRSRRPRQPSVRRSS